MLNQLSIKKTGKKLVSLAFLSSFILCAQFATISQAKQLDLREYFVGEFDVDGFNTTEIETYHAKATIKAGKGSFLQVEIQHDRDSGLGTYYGYFSEVDKDTLRLDYKNVGGHKFTALCDYTNNADNFPKFVCNGNLQGTVGYDGVFVIHKVW